MYRTFRIIAILAGVLLAIGALPRPCIAQADNTATAPEFEIREPLIDLGNIEKGTVKEFSIRIKNTGNVDLTWNLVVDRPWIVPTDYVSLEDYEKWLRTVDADTVASVGTGSYGFVDSSQEEGEEKPGRSTLSPHRIRELHFATYTRNLPEGDYSGSITIRSGAREEKITVVTKIVSLTSMMISPISIRIHAGQKRTFRTIGVWSDGSRTDLTDDKEGRWIISDHSIGSFHYKKPIFLARRIGHVEIKKIRGTIESNTAVVDVEEFMPEPVLFVSPREINLGAIGPGERAKGTFSLGNVGSKRLAWTTGGLASWDGYEEQDLSGTIEKSSQYLRVHVESITKETADSAPSDATTGFEETPSLVPRYPVAVTIETRNRAMVFRKDLRPGSYREMVPLHSNGGTRHLFIAFEVAEESSQPRLSASPPSFDLGVVEVGKRLVKKVELINAGKEVLKWKARLQADRKNFSGIPLKRGRYISFYNSSIVNKEHYVVSERLKDSMFLSGMWHQDAGYPSTDGEQSSLKTTFFGTGIVVFLWRDIEGGVVTAYVDDEEVAIIDTNATKRERIEIPVSEDLQEGPHILDLVCQRGNVAIEGIRIYGMHLLRGQEGWIRMYPQSGTTAKEKDFVNIMINTRDLTPGIYSENLLFASNGGNEIVDLTLEVSSINKSKYIEIYRYTNGHDYLYTANPGSEDPLLLQGYESNGVAFKLYRKGARGTTEFYRWFNPSKGVHFYSYDREGGGKSLDGYRFEGTMGNIATSRLLRTKELYRWINRVTGAYFYSTDLKGEGRIKEEYVYDGIAGYVR